ncbi:NUDIX hydrolase [Novosphingobium sp. 17-62-19]|uniref:NUDIX hydrolase n=1 Tax=Novosphingobium sp. 17-62-19 TaxID=1970406 RepID=UPI0025FE5194|nr:NUDIX hydrolase [Novosphingobium sp. 17-62-19]HQS95585.1 NUDIX hydrolase [Novosphingobium sp.]
MLHPILTVDIVPLTLRDGQLCVLRTLREAEPFAGCPALIGGFVHTDEDAHLGAAARRVLHAKAGLADLYVEQLSTFSGPDRDPRGWSASVVYFSLSPIECLQPALDHGLHLTPVDAATGMPFDHDRILAAALERLRGKGAYSDLPARLLPSVFTLADLHEVYEIALGERLNADAFRRKAMERNFLEDTGEKRRMAGANKPSVLYRLRSGHAVFDRRI